MQQPLQDAESQLTDGDIALMQQYLNSLADAYLNKDHRSHQSIQILSRFDDETNILSDKIKMVLMEQFLFQTVIKTRALEKELVSSKNDVFVTMRQLNEMNIFVSAMRRDFEQLQSEAAVLRQKQQHQMPPQPPSPINVSTSMFYQKTQHVPSTSGVVAASSAPSKSQQNTHHQLQQETNPHTSNSVVIEFAEIEPNSLVALTEAILNDKGPLPVGEVGKMLQEATGNLQFTQLIKEKHNGLKKFLEKYADFFLMSSDHPFNPHVYLRKCYTLDQQIEIENGSKEYLDKNKVSCVFAFVVDGLL